MILLQKRQRKGELRALQHNIQDQHAFKRCTARHTMTE